MWQDLISPTVYISALAVFLVFVVAFGLIPVPTSDIRSHSSPAASYEEALAKFAELRALDAKESIRPEGESILLSHGHKTGRVYVLLHGLTNCPQQFRQFGELLFKEGANVVIPRLRYHGLKDRMNSAHGDLTAVDMLEQADRGIDIAHGLADKITVVGLSATGASAAWEALIRNHLDQVVLLSPLFGCHGLSPILNSFLLNTLSRLPNHFFWWDPRRKDSLPGPYYSYPRFATHQIAETLRLSRATQELSKQQPPTARAVLLVLSLVDLAIDRELARRIVNGWRRSSRGRTKVEVYQFPAADKIRHDMIDPLQPGAKTDLVYQTLIDQMRSL